MSSTLMFWRRIRYSSKSSGPSKVSRKTSSASGGMYRSCGSSLNGAPYTRASGLGAAVGCARSRAASPLVIAQSHRLAHVAHRLLGELSRALAAIGNDVAHERRIVEKALRALADRLLLADDRVDHRLLALEATDPRSRATLPHPVARLLIRVDLMQAPDGAPFRIARIGAAHSRGVGLHRPDLLRDDRRLFAQQD